MTIDFPLYTCWFSEFIRIASGLKIREEKLMNGIFTREIKFNFHQYPRGWITRNTNNFIIGNALRVTKEALYDIDENEWMKVKYFSISLNPRKCILEFVSDAEKRDISTFVFFTHLLARPRISAKFVYCGDLGAVRRPLTRARKLSWQENERMLTARKQVGNIARSDRGFTCGAADYGRDRGPASIWQRAAHLVIAMHRQFLRRI